MQSSKLLQEYCEAVLAELSESEYDSLVADKSLIDAAVNRVAWGWQQNIAEQEIAAAIKEFDLIPDRPWDISWGDE